jgi:NitT/TauT family transport system permease protein
VLETSRPAAVLAGRRKRWPWLQPAVVRLAWQLVLLVAMLAAWQELVEHHVLTTLAVSKPTDIWKQLLSLSRGGLLLSSVIVTFEETIIGYAIGVILGVSVGFLLAFLPRVRSVLDPYVTMLNSLPRFALAPLYILWFGIGIGSKIALVVSLVVFIVFINTIEGVRAVDPDIIAISRLFGASRLQLVRKVIAPSAFPWIVASMRLSIAYAIAGAVVGEMFASNQGIGYIIVAGSGVFNTAEIFSGLIIIMIIAWIIDWISRKVESKILRWRPEIQLS